APVAVRHDWRWPLGRQVLRGTATPPGHPMPREPVDRTAAPPPRAAALDYARLHELRDAARRPAALRSGAVAAARPEPAAELRPAPSSRPRRHRPGARRPRPRRPGPRPPPRPDAAHGDARGPVGPPRLGLRPRVPARRRRDAPGRARGPGHQRRAAPRGAAGPRRPAGGARRVPRAVADRLLARGPRAAGAAAGRGRAG